MDTDKFQKYIEERYYDQINWYDNKSLSNQRWYRQLQWGLIVFSALTTGFNSYKLGVTNLSAIKMGPHNYFCACCYIGLRLEDL